MEGRADVRSESDIDLEGEKASSGAEIAGLLSGGSEAGAEDNERGPASELEGDGAEDRDKDEDGEGVDKVQLEECAPLPELVAPTNCEEVAQFL
jgi:hypothetical protein